MLIKLKSILILSLVLAILTVAPQNVLSQSSLKQGANQFKRTIQSLPNGYYFYGKSPFPDQQGKEYIVFRKKGRTLIGIIYTPPGEMDCFKGIINRNLLTKVTLGYADVDAPGGWRFQSGKPWNLNGYYRINSQAIESWQSRYLSQFCIPHFSK